MLILLCKLYILIHHVTSEPSKKSSEDRLNQTENSLVGARNFKAWMPDSKENPWEMSGEFEGDIKVEPGVGVRNVMRRRLWPHGIIPYTIVTPGMNLENIAVIRSAMRTIEDAIYGPCRIKFVPRTPNDLNFVMITSDHPRSCWSYIGMKGGPQQLSLGKSCMVLGTVIHELLHVLGFAHQHAAYNRDQHIQINWHNIMEGQAFNFKKINNRDWTDFGLEYDFQSIMHYSPFAFSKRRLDGRYVGPTMTPLDRSIRLKRNERLSEIDKLKLKLMYCKQQNIFG